MQTLEPAFTYQWAEGKQGGPPREAQALAGHAAGILGSTTKSCRVWRFGSSSLGSSGARGARFLFRGSAPGQHFSSRLV